MGSTWSTLEVSLDRVCNSPSIDEGLNLNLIALLFLQLDPACGDVDFTKLGITTPPPEMPVFTEGIPSHVSRTNILVGIYVAFNALWMIASCMLLCK